MRSKANLDFFTLLEKFFSEYLPTTINASVHTIKSYKCAFRLLLQFLNNEKNISTAQVSFEVLTFDILNEFFDWLSNNRNNSRVTMKQRMGALASFADYSQSRNLEATYGFWSGLSKISKKSFRRVKSKERCSFTRRELEILFSLPDVNEKLGFRDFTILVVMYSSGARAQEICDLRYQDITYDNNGTAILRLFGKGNKSRRVKLTTDATDILNKYIRSLRTPITCSNHVFSSQRNEHISVSCIEEIFAKYVKRAKEQHQDLFCSSSYTPHVMRHTTATHLIEAGVPLAVVKNILGHSSIQTTQVYVEITQQTINKSMEMWNHKWFPTDNINENVLSAEKKSIPEFLF